VTDMHDDLRELLQRRAAEVPSHLDVPRSLTGRVRRRIALNVVGVGLTVVVLAGGALAGVRAFNAAPRQDLGGPPPSSVQETPSTSALACVSAQIRAVGSMQGAAGSREGGISLTNFSDATCTLQGTPTITLLDKNLEPIISGVTFSSSPPGWEVDGSPQPDGWPVVTVRSGESVVVRIRWSNWCPNGTPAPLWRLDIPGGGAVDISNGLDGVAPPACNGPGQPSTVEVGPFEPGADP
jgi:hypothetical protein